MRSSRIQLMLLVAPLLLTGCGDGWEAQRTTEILPYGNQRTAGSGVVYVRAKMLPEKDIIVESQAKGYEEIQSAEPVFTKAQVKGAAPPPPEVKADAAKADAVKTSEEAVKETKVKAADEAEKTSEVVPAAGEVKSSDGVAEDVKKAIGETKAKEHKSYEQMLDEQGSIAPSKVEPHAGNAEIGKQSSLVSAPGASSIEIIQVPEEVKYTATKQTTSSAMPVKEIRSPMLDVYNRDKEAEKSLEEIYSNPF